METRSLLLLSPLPGSKEQEGGAAGKRPGGVWGERCDWSVSCLCRQLLQGGGSEGRPDLRQQQRRRVSEWAGPLLCSALIGPLWFCFASFPLSWENAALTCVYQCLPSVGHVT